MDRKDCKDRKDCQLNIPKHTTSHGHFMRREEPKLCQTCEEPLTINKTPECAMSKPRENQK